MLGKQRDFTFEFWESGLGPAPGMLEKTIGFYLRILGNIDALLRPRNAWEAEFRPSISGSLCRPDEFGSRAHGKRRTVTQFTENSGRLFLNATASEGKPTVWDPYEFVDSVLDGKTGGGACVGNNGQLYYLEGFQEGRFSEHHRSSMKTRSPPRKMTT